MFSRFGGGRQSCQLQASRATFLAGSESDVRHWHRGFGSAVGTGMPRCFPVSEAAAKAVSCRLQRCQLQASSRATFLAGSKSDVRHWHRGFGSAVGTGMPQCFPVSEAAAKAVSCRLQRCQLQASRATFLAGSESDVRHWHRGFGSAVGSGMPRCFPVSEAAAKAVSCRLQGLLF